MSWLVFFHTAFDGEYAKLSETVQEELLAHLVMVQQIGPTLGRPKVDTLKGSRHTNMKELRFDADGGVWRFALAFDPERNSIVLCGGDKKGANEKKFYRDLIDKADKRFDEHLAWIAGKRRDNVKKFSRKN